MFLRKKKGVVGLDIGSSAVKLVELKAAKGGRFGLLHAAHAPLSPEAIVEGTVMDSSLVVEVAQRLIQEQGVKNPSFGISLSGISVAIRKIQVPAMSEAELAESIHWEAEQYLPFDVNEVNLDYVVLGSDADTMDVLLVAAKKDRIADYTGIVTQLGKAPVLVDVDVFALQNAYEYNYGVASDRVVALVNVGAHIMNVNILAHGQSVFWRDIVFGGNAYTEAIQRELNLTREQAEAVKTGEQLGDHTPQTILGVLNGVSEDLAAELQKTFEFFYTTSSHDHVEEIVLAGGSCQVLNLDEVLKDRLRARVEVMNPFREIEYSESQFPPEWLNRHAPSMAAAVGMALRTAGEWAMIKINLLTEARAEKVTKAPVISLGTANLNNYILLAALILAIGWVGLRYWQLSSRLTDVKTQVAENQREYDRLKPIIEEVEAFKKKNAELRHKIEVIEQLKANQFGPVRLMDEVSKALPELLWLTDLGVNGTAISIRGQALNENAVANFIANLGASPFFSEPVLKIMSQTENGVFNFDLSCTFSYTPRDAAQASAPTT